MAGHQCVSSLAIPRCQLLPRPSQLYPPTSSLRYEASTATGGSGVNLILISISICLWSRARIPGHSPRTRSDAWRTYLRTYRWIFVLHSSFPTASRAALRPPIRRVFRPFWESGVAPRPAGPSPTPAHNSAACTTARVHILHVRGDRSSAGSGP